METSGPADVPGESKERKKIQFAVPSTAPTQLDPRQVEMVSDPHVHHRHIGGDVLVRICCGGVRHK